jgi:hypothetical protein
MQKTKTNQIGCSAKRRQHKKTRRNRGGLIRGGDAYNEIPARYIYPLNDNVMAKPVDARMTGGKRSRKYLKKFKGVNLKGVNLKGGSLKEFMFPFNLNDAPAMTKFNSNNPYLT